MTGSVVTLVVSCISLPVLFILYELVRASTEVRKGMHRFFFSINHYLQHVNYAMALKRLMIKAHPLSKMNNNRQIHPLFGILTTSPETGSTKILTRFGL